MEANFNNTSILLTSLLPNNLESRPRVVDVAKNLYFLFKAAQNTLNLMEKNRIDAFDPLVGENFCQSRAVYILAKWKRCCKSFKEKIVNISEKVRELELYVSKNGKVEKNFSLEDFIQQYDLSLSKKEYFFIISYLLTVTKTRTISTNILFVTEKTEPKKWDQIAPISSTSKDRLLAKLRSNLALASVNYVLKQAHKIAGKNSTPFLSDRFIHYHNKNLACLPFYRGTKALMLTALKLKIPLIFWTRQIDLGTKVAVRNSFSYYLSDGEKYRAYQMDDKTMNSPLLIFQGIALRKIKDFSPEFFWNKQIFKRKDLTPLKMIAAAAASHPQYPGKDQEMLSDEQDLLNDRELTEYKKLAQEEGFSSECPFLFFTNHVFADKLSNLAPLNFRTNNHLRNYYPFYFQVLIQKIQKYYEKKGWGELTYNKEKFEISIELNKESKVFGYFLSKRLFGYVSEHALCSEECEDRVIFKIKYSHSFADSIIGANSLNSSELMDYAKINPDPTKFLLDHRSLWSHEADTIIHFLMQNEKNYECGEFLEAIFDHVMNFYDTYSILSHKPRSYLAHFVAIEKALLYPHLKEKAEEMLKILNAK